MSCHIVTRYGQSIYDPTPPEMQAALAELKAHDPEHPDCYLTHDESGWTLAAFGSGLLVWENYTAPEAGARHIRTTHTLTLKHWEALAAGHVDQIEALPWQRGYGQ